MSAHKIFDKTKEKSKIMNVTPFRHTVAFTLDNFFFNFFLFFYFDNKRYIFESLTICWYMLWSPISILYIGRIFFLEEHCDGVTYWWSVTCTVILREIRYCYIQSWPYDNRWPVVNHYFVLHMLISKTDMFLDKKFFFLQTRRCDIHNSSKQFHLKLNSFYFLLIGVTLQHFSSFCKIE